ncbi:fungal-specific transcription factor domain-domain-containing protein [Kockovaella imperatae]|uniref:Fungal-specific transcription factor domain-domain-containing protein n=1 Tax=Kockovaella imperatae TaxID=4999 RepID=A0A1Y1ULL2_9TREE|nr:fungal-specific transcription factor domain-domain-containing protein [Kockovaella imperatae]ORX38872.1 fungal-specific transcription factor domain-domain-containing protein [Kockovaella imperatae]
MPSRRDSLDYSDTRDAWEYPSAEPESSTDATHGRASFSGSTRTELSPNPKLNSNTKRSRRDSLDTSLSLYGGEDTGPGGRPLAVTCAPCRARKIKCDSKKPACDNCAKNPKECYYPIKLKPGLRAGSGNDMMKRLEQLESRLEQHEIRLADQEMRLNAASLYSQQPGSTLHPLSATTGPNPQTMSVNNQILSYSSIHPLASPVMSRSLPEMGPPSVPTPVPLPLDLIGSSSAFNGPSASPSGLSTTSFHDPNILPPPDIVHDLVALFWVNIHPWAPILSPTPVAFQQPWSIIVHAIVVVTLRLSHDARLEGKKEHYKRAAKQHVLSHAIESTSISSVQALALLALDLIGSEQGPSSWGILALLTRSAVHLGLTSEDDLTASSFTPSRAPAPSLSRTSIIPPAADWREDESRRRLFWLIFALDRYACLSTGWDFALPDFDITRRLPCTDELWARPEWIVTPQFRPIPHLLVPQPPENLSPFSYLVEVLDLCGRAHTLQSQVLDPSDARAVDRRRDASVTLNSAARRWFAHLPLKDGRQNGLSLMVQAIFHATLLKVNAYYAFPALSNGDPVEPFTSHCLTSAHAVAALTVKAREIGWMSASTPLFIWSCWVAARVLFVHAFLSHHNQPDANFDGIVAALKEQSQFWALANGYVKLLERAKKKWLQSASGEHPNLPDAIHVLLDLRRTAYSAVAGAGNTDATPHVSPPDVNLSHLPAWAVQPLLGDLHSWFDLPAGVFQGDM